MQIAVSDSTAFTGECLAELAKGCPHLSSVTVRCCDNLDREHINAFAKSCPKLKSIKIESSTEWHDKLYVETADRCVPNATAAWKPLPARPQLLL